MNNTEIKTVGFGGMKSHVIKNEQATRWGLRYNAICGTYGFNAQTYGSPVTCPRCIAKLDA